MEEDKRPKETHARKIASFGSLAPGAVVSFRWENPPWDTVVAYSAYPLLPISVRPGVSAQAIVEIVRTRLCIERDEKGNETRYALIDVRNSGSGVCGFELYQSWLQRLPE